MHRMHSVELLATWISARVDVAVGEKAAAGEHIEQLAHFTCTYESSSNKLIMYASTGTCYVINYHSVQCNVRVRDNILVRTRQVGKNFTFVHYL